MRIPLGRKVLHHAVNETMDKFFHGKKFTKYPDESVHYHIELMMDIGDSYVAESETYNDAASVCADDLSLYTAGDKEENSIIEKTDKLAEEFEQLSEEFEAMVEEMETEGVGESPPRYETLSLLMYFC